MKKLVFLCRGNKLRSPIAETIFNKNPKTGWVAFSYGTAVEKEGWENMKISDFDNDLNLIVNELKKDGIDISNKICQQVQPKYLDDANKIIVMAEKDTIPDWLEQIEYERWNIPNPNNILEFHEQHVVLLLNQKIGELKKAL